MSLFYVKVIKLCKGLSKLDLPTLRKGSREERKYINILDQSLSKDIEKQHYHFIAGNDYKQISYGDSYVHVLQGISKPGMSKTNCSYTMHLETH